MQTNKAPQKNDKKKKKKKASKINDQDEKC